MKRRKRKQKEEIRTIEENSLKREKKIEGFRMNQNKLEGIRINWNELEQFGMFCVRVESKGFVWDLFLDDMFFKKRKIVGKNHFLSLF